MKRTSLRPPGGPERGSLRLRLPASCSSDPGRSRAASGYYCVLHVVQVGGSQTDVGLVVGAFTISALVLRLVVGRWLDQGRVRTRLLCSCGAIFPIVSLACPLIRGVRALLLRFFHGTGMAAYSTTSQTLIADSVPPTRFGDAMGFFGLAATVSMAFAPALDIALLGWSGFPLVFAVSAGAS